MGSSVQNARLLRFFIVLGAGVVLSLFIYASYNSNKSPLPHLPRAGTHQLSTLAFRNDSIRLKDESSKNTKVYLNDRKQAVLGVYNSVQHGAKNSAFKAYRQPTIDVESPADFETEELFEERILKDQQFSDNHNSNFVQPPPQLQEQEEISRNKIADNDFLIPTSNLQKFIENADNFVKNISSLSLPVQSSIDMELKETKTKNVEKLLTNMQSPLPTSLYWSSKMLNNTQLSATSRSSTTATTTTGNVVSSILDPVQGISTKQIYENGHRDNEINIDKICPGSGNELKLLIMITSAQSHQEARLAIRQTWGHYGIRRDISTVFILGRTTNETLNNILGEENFIYGDLVRGNFLDTYNNLTLKTVSALEWVDRHCSRAKHILKTDDDMFINVPKLLTFLEKHAQEKRVIYGRLAKKWKPIRNKKSKYYVSPGQFSATIFPAFTTGPAYVMSADIIHDLYRRALQQTYLKLEDVFTTGIIAQELGVKRVHVNEFLNRRISFNSCNIRKTISVHMIKANEQFELWKKLYDKPTKCK